MELSGRGGLSVEVIKEMLQAGYLTMQVLIRSSKIGKDVGNITLIDTTIPLPVYEMIAPEQLFVLERTILRLFNTIMENKTAFQTTSTGAGKFDAIANQGIQFRDAILKGKILAEKVREQANTSYQECLQPLDKLSQRESLNLKTCSKIYQARVGHRSSPTLIRGQQSTHLCFENRSRIKALTMRKKWVNTVGRASKLDIDAASTAWSWQKQNHKATCIPRLMEMNGQCLFSAI